MTQEQSRRISVTPAVAKLISKETSRETRLAAARGEAGLAGRDLVTALCFLCYGTDVEIRGEGVRTLRRQPAAALAAVAALPELPGQILNFLAQVCGSEAAVLAALLDNPSTPDATLAFLLERAGRGVLPLILERAERWHSLPEATGALARNPQLTAAERAALVPGAAQAVDAGAAEYCATEADEEEPAEDGEEQPLADEENYSKYQLALEMGVSEKIKMALTGDKEWRAIFLKDPNKLVNTAVLKNPRITDGEVLAVAKNKTTSEELIRLILLNKEWVKAPSIRAALVTHPKTPIPQALRFMNVLTEKDLKNLSKSKGVSQVIVNAARRMVTEKANKK